jgi:hypothetical protein
MIPSLLQIPSAVSDSKLHSVLPNNGKGDFQFDRSTGATRINREGLIEEVGYFSSELVQNGNFSELGSELVTNGNYDDNSAWTISGGNAEILNGKLNFDNAANYGTSVSNSASVVSGKTYLVKFTISNYSSGAAQIRLGSQFGTSRNANGTYTEYIVANATLIRLYSSSNNTTLSIDNVSVKQVDPNDRWNLGGCWSFGDSVTLSDGTGNDSITQAISLPTGKLRIKFDIITRTQGSVRLFINKPAFTELLNVSEIGSYEINVDTTSGANNIYFYATNLFIGSISNISVVEVQGDRPRLSYDITNGVVEDKPHLLLEPSSTNLVTFSNDYTQSTWSKLNFTANSETSLAPDGTTINGYNFGDGYLFMDLATMVNGASYTSSVYIKANKNGTIGLRKGGAGSAVEYTNINLTTSWQRFTSTSTATVANSGRFLLDNRTVNGFGVSDLKVFVYGAQNEQQSFATSFIPTAGTTITRAAETCNNSKPSVNSTEGVLYAEIAALANDSTDRRITISDGTTNNRMLIGFDDASNKIKYVLLSSNSIQVNEDVSVSDITQFNKIAFKFKANDFELYMNGSVIASDTSGSTFSAGTLNVVKFAGFSGTAQEFYGKVKALAVYNEALSESQLMQLTGVTASSIYNNFVTRTASFTVEALNEVKKVIDNL